MTSGNDFTKQIERIIRAAFEYGLSSVELKTDLKKPFENLQHYKRFVSGCHRGYSKAQNTIFKLLKENAVDVSLSHYERRRREYLLRKIIDSIAFNCLQGETYLARRVCIHDETPNLDFPVIEKALEMANRFNADDRMTFSILADLSTFIHICDIIKIDRNNGRADLSFMEIKEGTVNKVLFDKIKKYQPDSASIYKINQDIDIPDKFRKQAQRMQRQRIRMRNVFTILESDSGIDPQLNMPMRMNHTKINEVSYADFFGECAEKTLKLGAISFTINHCLHFGMASIDDSTEKNNRLAASYAFMGKRLCQNDATGKLSEFTAVRL